MSTSPVSYPAGLEIPTHIHSSCEFAQVLMKLQRATHLIASARDLETLLDRVVRDIAAHIGSVEVEVWLRDEDADAMVLQGVCGCTIHRKGTRLAIGRQGMVGYVAANGEMRYAPDVSRDPYYMPCEADTRSEVCLPLKSGAIVTGVLSIAHREIDPFSEDQLSVLQALAGHVAVAIENARVYGRERQERERMEREAESAREMQRALFLKPVPLVPGFAFEAAWQPAGAVAGDWFDFLDLGEGRYGIALADVSGKGMPAALLMSATRAMFRTIAAQYRSPGPALEHLNRSMIDDFPSGHFVTMVYGVLDARSREITLASAGHLQPMLINGHCSFLALETGLPLGLALSSYPEQSVSLSAGTRLLLYTDGITEAMNHTDEEYGAHRLMHHFVQPDACVDGLIAEIQRHAAASSHTDDATAVLIRSR